MRIGQVTVNLNRNIVEIGQGVKLQGWMGVFKSSEMEEASFCTSFGVRAILPDSQRFAIKSILLISILLIYKALKIFYNLIKSSLAHIHLCSKKYQQEFSL